MNEVPPELPPQVVRETLTQRLEREAAEKKAKRQAESDENRKKIKEKIDQLGMCDMSGDHYRFFNVSSDTLIDEIQRRYKLIMKYYHTDLNSDAGAEDISKMASEAWAVLGDDQKRLEYNKLHNLDQPPAAHARAETPPADKATGGERPTQGPRPETKRRENLATQEEIDKMIDKIRQGVAPAALLGIEPEDIPAVATMKFNALFRKYDPDLYSENALKSKVSKIREALNRAFIAYNQSQEAANQPTGPKQAEPAPAQEPAEDVPAASPTLKPSADDGNPDGPDGPVEPLTGNEKGGVEDEPTPEKITLDTTNAEFVKFIIWAKGKIEKAERLREAGQKEAARKEVELLESMVVDALTVLAQKIILDEAKTPEEATQIEEKYKEWQDKLFDKLKGYLPSKGTLIKGAAAGAGGGAILLSGGTILGAAAAIAGAGSFWKARNLIGRGALGVLRNPYRAQLDVLQDFSAGSGVDGAKYMASGLSRSPLFSDRSTDEISKMNILKKFVEKRRKDLSTYHRLRALDRIQREIEKVKGDRHSAFKVKSFATLLGYYGVGAALVVTGAFGVMDRFGNDEEELNRTANNRTPTEYVIPQPQEALSDEELARSESELVTPEIVESLDLGKTQIQVKEAEGVLLFEINGETVTSINQDDLELIGDPEINKDGSITFHLKVVGEHGYFDDSTNYVPYDKDTTLRRTVSPNGSEWSATEVVE